MARKALTRSATDFLPARHTLPALREAAAGCRGCDLYKNATQTVFGEGARHARVLLVGEQPGDKEDLQGKPFVGPAGMVLDRALAAAGVGRAETYVTNVVKHFKWEPRGKRRLHKKPGALEIAACMPWFEAELEAVKPEIIVCLGATAAQALLGRQFRVTQRRGEVLQHPHNAAPVLAAAQVPVMATIHPSAVLRAPDEVARREEMTRFVDDLKVVARFLEGHSAERPRAA